MEYSLTRSAPAPLSPGVLILILMEYSLTSLHSVKHDSNKVLILILMEYSLTHLIIGIMEMKSVLILILMEYSLTIYQRVSYTFSRQSFHTVFPLSIRKLSRWKPFFRKCGGLRNAFQIKTVHFSNICLDVRRLHLRKTKHRLNCFRDLRKTPKREICKGLVINTLLHRAEADTDAFSQM